MVKIEHTCSSVEVVTLGSYVLLNCLKGHVIVAAVISIAITMTSNSSRRMPCLWLCKDC